MLAHIEVMILQDFIGLTTKTGFQIGIRKTAIKTVLALDIDSTLVILDSGVAYEVTQTIDKIMPILDPKRVKL